MLQNALMRSTAAESVKNAARWYTFRFHPEIVAPKRVLSKLENWFYACVTIGNAAKHVKSVANVDIRGTGSSEDVLIEREYTSQELDDGERVVELLARHSRSNGRVGMHGLSWTAFNSLMMATLRHPPALRAIFAAHGSEDLYKNDIHFMDGILHQDEYILSVDHENALPAPPQYIMDEKWIKERFTARPWIDVYLEHQLDGEFWQKHSIKYAYENFTLPAYLLAGFYDG
ncbi:unnamed protein product [Rotaria magnacalcarata]|uniref:Xaa-Pro dipeptidyl-peptidase-like domain-containing protein n=1 Tax=Rotaria magnacalcarata TaxID=392030 RepID=A0A816TDG0_9BILA|nr:unnamed protein product [Rotaria magnacalcarata]